MHSVIEPALYIKLKSYRNHNMYNDKHNITMNYSLHPEKTLSLIKKSPIVKQHFHNTYNITNNNFRKSVTIISKIKDCKVY